MALLLIPLAALSFTPKLWMKVSTDNTADATIQTKAGYFYGMIVHTDGSWPVTVNAYDNDTSAAGTKIVASWIVTSSSTDRTQSMDYDPPVPYEVGIHVDISTAGTVSYDVFYHASDD